jgi:hypothetical protein
VGDARPIDVIDQLRVEAGVLTGDPRVGGADTGTGGGARCHLDGSEDQAGSHREGHDYMAPRTATPDRYTQFVNIPILLILGGLYGPAFGTLTAIVHRSFPSEVIRKKSRWSKWNRSPSRCGTTNIAARFNATQDPSAPKIARPNTPSHQCKCTTRGTVQSAVSRREGLETSAACMSTVARRPQQSADRGHEIRDVSRWTTAIR